MNSEQLKQIQTPLKELYKDNADAAMITLKAEGQLGAGISCKVETGKQIVEAGLHKATGGTGQLACSGDMLLEALVACAGVTLSAVSTSLNIPIIDGTVKAEGDLDFRGTLGVSKEASVGLTRIRLSFELQTDASDEQLQTLAKLTERYCVVYQTLVKGVEVGVNFSKKE